MLPYRQQRPSITLESSNVEVWDVETHRTLLSIYLEEVAAVVEIGKRESESALDNSGYSSLVFLASKYSPRPVSDISPALTSVPASASSDVVSISRITIRAA